MNIEETFPTVLALIAADSVCGSIPRVSQLDPEYDTALEEALEQTGVAFVLWAGDGIPFEGNDGPSLDLVNGMILTVIERRKKNATGATAIVWVRRLLRLLHQNGAGNNRGRILIRHPARGPAYELGPLGQGLVIYFVNLEVRSIEPTGALPPP